MSKIGQKIIVVDNAVTVTINGNVIEVSGQHGSHKIELPNGLKVTKNDSQLLVERSSNNKDLKALHGLYRSLISNAVTGVVKPWVKNLEIVGTGFNVKQQGESLIFKVGYSHLVTFEKVNGVTYKVQGTNKVTVSGSDKQQVGEIAYKIKSIRKPDPYKGKGIRFEGEVIRLKAGKKAK